jgi:hypothetical protein
MEPALTLSNLIDPVLAVVLGLSLAATCGLRAFLPLLTISLLGWLGKVELGSSFAFMSHPVTALCLATAVVAETLGDKVPAVDHALDGLGVFVKPIAAAVATAAVITDMDPMLAMSLGLIGGGTLAEGVHLAKAKTRLASSAFTGTLANPVLSLIEDGLALAGVILAWLVPALVLSVGLLFVAFFVRRRLGARAARAA